MFKNNGWAKLGFAATVVYGGLVYWFARNNEQSIIQDFIALPLNNKGDALGGVFAPLAFLWLFVATMIQGQELALTRQVMKEQSETSAQQAKAAEDQATFSRMQTEVMMKQAKELERTADLRHRSEMFERRIAIYDEFISFGEQAVLHKQFGDGQYATLEKLAHKAQFVFGEDIAEWFNDILSQINEIITADVGIAINITEATKTKDKQKYRDNIAGLESGKRRLIGWFEDQFLHEILDAKFDAYLNLNRE